MVEDVADSRPPRDCCNSTCRTCGRALAAGWRDFRRAPAYGLFFALVYVLGGWLIWWAIDHQGADLVDDARRGAGFPILGPFIACGFTRSRAGWRRASRWTGRQVFGVIFRQKDRQIPSMAAVIVVFFLFWNFLSHMIFALFLGNATMTNVSSSLQVFLTPEGLAMLAFGTRWARCLPRFCSA
jgi:uncharacterized membrane protein